MTEIEFIAESQPRHGSDFCLHALARHGERTAAVLGVADTIGQPRQVRELAAFIRRFAARLQERVADPDGSRLDALTEGVAADLLAGNDELRRIGGDPADPFGFSVVLGVFDEARGRLFHLGDCRAYLVGPRAGNPQAPIIARCLTRDHNALHEILQRQARHVFLKSELLDYSRRLEYYWGMPGESTLEDLVRRQTASVELAPNCGLLMMTDGLYLPLIRELLYHVNFTMSAEQYYLGPWFEFYFAQHPYFRDGVLLENWNTLLSDLLQRCAHYTAIKRRYRDSIAALWACWI